MKSRVNPKVLVVMAVVVSFGAGYLWLAPSKRGPAPLAKEFMSVAYGGRPSDVTVYVKFAPGDQEAVVRAAAGKLSCVLDTEAADDERSPRFGWLVTGAHCGPRECADGTVALDKDGKSTACDNSELSAGTIEERSIQTDKCTPDSDHACVGIDLDSLRKAAESGQFKLPSASSK